MKTRITILKMTCAAVLGCLSILHAQTEADYFPLHYGDYRIQESDSIMGMPLSVMFKYDVQDEDTLEGVPFFRIKQQMVSEDSLINSSWYTWMAKDTEGILLGAFGNEPEIQPLIVPTQTITVDGNITDWTGVSSVLTDPQYDDSTYYTGDDIKEVFLAKDASNLYCRIDLWDYANTYFGNGPAPYEGYYRVLIRSNGSYNELEVGLAYDMSNAQWSLGYNGSNDNAPVALTGPSYVGVIGGTIEIQIPLSMVGNPTVYYGIEFDVYISDDAILDEAATGHASVYVPPLVWVPSGPATPGSSWFLDVPQMGGLMHFTLEAVDETVQVPAGTFNGCVRISLVITSPEGDTVQTGDYSYAPGVGEVRNTGWNQGMGNYNLKLTGYYVQVTSLAVETQVGTAVAGSDLVIGASLSRVISPTVRRLYYRKGGETAFKLKDMTPDGADYTATIPAADVGIRGLEYYVRFSDGQIESTYPAINPALEPAQIQVRVENMEAPLEIEALKYQMISIPLVLTDPSVQAVLIDDYSEYDDNVWRLCIYQETDTSYFLEYPDFSRTFTPGSAFWFISRTGDSFDVGGGLSVPTDEPMEFMFYPGWNQVANPVAYPLLVDTTGEELNLELPVFYNGDDYEYNVMTMQPWTGYFVKNNGTQPVTYYLDPVEAPASVPKFTPHKFMTSADDYIIQLEVRTEGFNLIDTQNYLGFLEGTKEGHDRRDISEAPPIGDHIRFSIIDDGKRMAGSFKPLNSLGQEWDIDLTCTIRADVHAVVTLEESGQMPDSMDIHILDMDDQCIIPVRDHTFKMLLKKANPVKHLKLIIGTEGYASRQSEGISLHPEYFTLYQNYPNPFNMETVLPYDIWNRGWVRIDIYSITGQRIRTLVDKMQDPGKYIERWNGTDRFGRPMPGGVYFCRIRMDALTETKKLILLR